MEKLHEGSFEKNCNCNFDLLRVRRCCRSASLNTAAFGWGSRAPRRGPTDHRPQSGLRGLRVYNTGDLQMAGDCWQPQSPPSPWNYTDYYCYREPYTGRGHLPDSYYYSSYPGGYCVSSSYVTGLYTPADAVPALLRRLDPMTRSARNVINF
jgi:hypothetical protein